METVLEVVSFRNQQKSQNDKKGHVLSAFFKFLHESPRHLSSVQFLQHRGDVHQAELAAKVAHNGGVVQHQQLPHALSVAALAQVDGLQQVAEVQVPEGHAALAPCHQQRFGDHSQTGPAAHLLDEVNQRKSEEETRWAS